MAILWTNTQIDIETARTASQAITSISKANPAVVTYSGADPANGDYVVFIDIEGMVEVVDRVFRVANVNAAGNTFEVEGLDSTSFQTFVSGSFAVLTFGASMTTVQQVNSGGGDFQFAELTTIHDTRQKRAPTTASPFTLALQCLFKANDAAHVRLERLNDIKQVASIRIRWPSGEKALFAAYVGAAGIPTGQAQGPVQTNVTFEGQGKPTIYAT